MDVGTTISLHSSGQDWVIYRSNGIKSYKVCESTPNTFLDIFHYNAKEDLYFDRYLTEEEFREFMLEHL